MALKYTDGAPKTPCASSALAMAAANLEICMPVVKVSLDAVQSSDAELTGFLLTIHKSQTVVEGM